MRLPVPSRQSCATTLSEQDISCGRLRSEFFNILSQKRTFAICDLVVCLRQSNFPRRRSFRRALGQAKWFTQPALASSKRGFVVDLAAVRRMRNLHQPRQQNACGRK